MFFMLLTILFLPISCNDNDEILFNSDSNADKVHFTIGVSLSGSSKSETRGFGDEGIGSGGYYEFSDLYVAVFVDIDGVSYLDEFVKADKKPPVWNDTEKCWDFEVSLAKTTESRRLHIIANYPNLTMGFGEEGQLIGRLLANGENHDVYWNYCDVNKIDMTADSDLQTKLQKVPLLRNYVKIMLNDSRASGNKTNFTIDAYALYNVPTKGTVAPYNPSGVKKFANFVTNGRCQSYAYLLETEKYEGNEPFDDGTLISTNINWIEVENGTIPPAFMYERSNRTAPNPTCMLIKGRYNSEGSVTASTPVTYYKLDFVYADNATNSKVYYNLLRNFIYTMNLKSVTGSGYATVEEAITQPASNNIGGDAVAKDYTNISDGTNQLFVSTTYMMLTSNKEVYLYYKYLEGTTISNSKVKVTALAGNVLSEAALVATSDEEDGQYAGWRKVTLKPKSVTAVSQGQELIFAAGDLQRKVELVLRQAYRLTVATPNQVMPITKSLFDITITLPSGIAPSLFPLRLFISSENNTIYPNYGTNMPAEAQNGKYGFIKEVSLDDYNNSTDKVFICKFLTNCPRSATTVYVDNEYFEQGSDAFTNSKITTFNITTLQQVSYENYGGRTPERIYYNGTEEVIVKLNNTQVGKIIIGKNNVTQIATLEYSAGFDFDDILTFTFSDRYYRSYGFGGGWQNAATYTSTCTVEELLSGQKTLHFAR